MSRAPRLLRFTGLIVGGAAAIVCAAIPVLAVNASWPTVTRTPAEIAQNSRPGDTLLACDGPILALGRDASHADQTSVAGNAKMVDNIVTGEASTNDLGIIRVKDATARSIVISPSGEEPGAGAAAQSLTLKSDDLLGFAASACRVPIVDSWLVGADSGTGTTGLLRLSNPGDVAAPITITVYGTDGPTAQGAELVVPAKSQLTVPVSGIVSGNAHAVIRVSARASSVSATLQTSSIETLTPVGVDFQAAAAAPSMTQTIPGIVVANGSADVRLLAPDEDGTADIVPIAADGTRGKTVQVSLTAGQPVDGRLQGLSNGTYSFEIAATSNVVAAGRTAIDKKDFAWFPAASDITGTATAIVAEGPSPILSIANPYGSEARVVLRSGSETTEILIPAGGTVQRSLTSKATIQLSPDAIVRAGISFSSDSALGGYPIWEDTKAGGTVVVLP